MFNIVTTSLSDSLLKHFEATNETKNVIVILSTIFFYHDFVRVTPVTSCQLLAHSLNMLRIENYSWLCFFWKINEFTFMEQNESYINEMVIWHETCQSVIIKSLGMFTHVIFHFNIDGHNYFPNVQNFIITSNLKITDYFIHDNWIPNIQFNLKQY